MARMIIILAALVGASCSGIEYYVADTASEWAVGGDKDGDGWTEEAGDCDDVDPDINPNAEETCCWGDEDCDGIINEGDAIDADTWYPDFDGDGYGDPTSPWSACSKPAGFVENDLDCDDENIAVNPVAVEVVDCNLVDDNCDGISVILKDCDF